VQACTPRSETSDTVNYTFPVCPHNNTGQATYTHVQWCWCQTVCVITSYTLKSVGRLCSYLYCNVSSCVCNHCKLFM